MIGIARGLSACVALCIVLAAAPQPGDARANAFLARVLGLAPGELARVAQGQAVTKAIEPRDDREVATLGVVRIAVPPAYYVGRLTDITTFKRDEAVLQIGTFGTPPSPDDLRGLTLDRSDLDALRGCRVGRCGIQLPAAAIERFRRDVDWKAAGAEQQANALMREVLAGHARQYLASGADALPPYDDGSTPVSIGREMRDLITSDARVLPEFPALEQHLLEYPNGPGAEITDVLYWSKEQFGKKRIITITHLAISRGSGDAAVAYAIGSKQIYGSHYFDASLGLTLLLRDGTSPEPATCLVYLNRSRIDAFGGLFGGIARRAVRSRARSAAIEFLRRAQVKLQQDYHGSAR